MTKNLLLAAVLIATGTGVVLAGPVVTLNPVDGVISGNAGDTVGWGFDVQADLGHWISFTGSVTLSESNPSVGLYMDFIGFQGGPVNAVMVPFSPDWVQAFDGVNQTGLGGFTLDPGAVPGSSDSGVIRVLYASYVGDPNVCSICTQTSGFVDLPFTVNVTAPSPEPATWGLLLAGSVCLWWRRRTGRED
jgi:hypothetical protein